MALAGLRCGQEKGQKKGKQARRESRWKGGDRGGNKRGREMKERKEKDSEKWNTRPQAATALCGFSLTQNNELSTLYSSLCSQDLAWCLALSWCSGSVDWWNEWFCTPRKRSSDGEVEAVCVWTLHLLFQDTQLKIQGVVPQWGSQPMVNLCLVKRQSRDIGTHRGKIIQELTNLLCKGLEVNISVLASHAVSVIATQLCHCSIKAATHKI